MSERYYLALAGHPDSKQEVSKEEWIRAERGAGFRPKGEDRGQPATAGFGNGQVRGTIEYVVPAKPNRFEYPESPGDCYVDLDESNMIVLGDDTKLLLDADAAANYIASIISDFTGDEVDGDGDPWSIVCEHLSGLLDNLREVLNIHTQPAWAHTPECGAAATLNAYLVNEHGLTIRPPRPPIPREET